MADLGGIPTTAYEYASADFTDAEEQPLFFDTAMPLHSDLSYSILLNNTLERHTHEMREKSQMAPITSTQWRRRFREFLTGRVKDLLEFAAKPLAKHPTLGPTEILLRKFGRPNFVANHHTLHSSTSVV